MEFGLRAIRGGKYEELVLDEPRYSEILGAQERVLQALYIEEKFNIIVANYLDFERVLYEIALDHMVFGNFAWSSGVESINSINRAVVNLLSASRLYLDQVPQRLGDIYGSDSMQARDLRSECSREYDAHLGYRVFYQLRNYILHKELPVSKIQHSSRWVDSEKSGLEMANVSIPMVSVEALARHKDFKRDVVEELTRMGAEFDLRVPIRAAVSCYARINAFVAFMLKEDVAKWASVIVDALTLFPGDAAPPNATVFRRSDREDLEPIERTVWVEPTERIAELQRRNRLSGELRTRFVSSGSNLPVADMTVERPKSPW